jgi:glycogen phosphorylase
VQIQAVLSKNGVFKHTPLKLETTGADGWLEYSGHVQLAEAGEWNLGVRAVPYREDLSNPLEVGLLRWA